MGGGVYDPHHMYSNYQSDSKFHSHLYIYIRCGGAIVNLFKIIYVNIFTRNNLTHFNFEDGHFF